MGYVLLGGSFTVYGEFQTSKEVAVAYFEVQPQNILSLEEIRKTTKHVC
jgi:hypothetical protein